MNMLNREEALVALEQGHKVFFHWKGKNIPVTSESRVEDLRWALLAGYELKISDIIAGQYSAHKVHSMDIEGMEFERIKNGTKNYIISDSGPVYEIADIIIIKEFNSHGYTGKEIEYSITYLEEKVHMPGYVIISIN